MIYLAALYAFIRAAVTPEPTAISLCNGAVIWTFKSYVRFPGQQDRGNNLQPASTISETEIVSTASTRYLKYPSNSFE